MSQIQWDPLYELGIRLIDDQHRRFVDIINEHDRAAGEGRSPEELEALLRELSGYAAVHFSTEERYFDAFACEGAEGHKAAHRGFLTRLDEIREQVGGDPRQASRELLEYLSDWLTNHIVLMDKNYVSCFKQHGLT